MILSRSITRVNESVKNEIRFIEHLFSNQNFFSSISNFLAYLRDIDLKLEG